MNLLLLTSPGALARFLSLYRAPIARKAALKRGSSMCRICG
jgi:hypothetical protein